MRKYSALALAATLSLAGISFADTVELIDGNKLTGKIGVIEGGKMSFNSPSLGDLTLELKNIKTYATDEAVSIHTRSAGTSNEKITSGDATQIVTADGKTTPVSDVKIINQPARKWTGSVVANFTLNRGNTNQFTVGVNGVASLRRDDDHNNDRMTLGGGYNYGESGGGPPGGPTTLSTDNWNGFGKYDRYWSEKWYGYAILKVEHDRLENLDYRISPGLGVGYQWVESERSNFSTEAGVTYRYEQYADSYVSKTLGNGTTKLVKVDEYNEDAIALRLAYHYDRQLAENVKLFHNLEYLPAFNDPGDFLLTTDIGVRVNLTGDFFAEARFLWQHDSTPSEGSLENQLDYLIGLGWQF